MGDFYGYELNDLEYRTIPYVNITSMSWDDDRDHSKGAIVRVDTGDDETRLSLAVSPQDYENPEDWAYVVYQLEELWDQCRWQNAA